VKKVVILQSSSIPWKGYFDLIRETNFFLDDVQFTKNDWCNRHKLRTKSGVD